MTNEITSLYVHPNLFWNKIHSLGLGLSGDKDAKIASNLRGYLGGLPIYTSEKIEDGIVFYGCEEIADC